MDDDFIGGLALIVVAVTVAPFVLAVALVVFLVIGLAWCVREVYWAVERRRWVRNELAHIAFEREATLRHLEAIRSRAERRMAEVAREDVIEGTACEVERRRGAPR